MKSEKLQEILNNTIEHKRIFGVAFSIQSDAHSWNGSAGNLTAERPFFIASTTKLFCTSILLKFHEAGKIQLHQKISDFLDVSILQSLHYYQGKDYSNQIRIQDLMAHTSGLADYFQDKGPSGISLEKELMKGMDQSWNLEHVLERNKKQRPLFIPGSKGKAHYSDTNYQLLGRIIENISGTTFAENCRKWIIEPLELKHTYVYANPEDEVPMHLYYRDKPLHIPKAMCSFGPDGGLVSTAPELLRFIEAFFKGQLFDSSILPSLMAWNPIFFPMQSGIGLHRFKLPWFLNPFGMVPEFWGHSGLSGALAYYCPKRELYIAGTVNQVAQPDLSFRTMIKLVQAIK